MAQSKTTRLTKSDLPTRPLKTHDKVAQALIEASLQAKNSSLLKDLSFQRRTGQARQSDTLWFELGKLNSGPN